MNDIVMAKPVGFISNRHGKFYAGFMLVDDTDSPRVAITGPFNTERQAEKWFTKWERLNSKLRKRGEPVTIPDAGSILPDVRAYITEGLRTAVRARGVDGIGNAPFPPVPFH